MIDPRVNLLLAGCALLGALIVVEAVTGGGAPVPEVPPPQVKAAPAVQHASAPRPEELLSITLAQPLFSPTRQPPEAGAGTGQAGFDLADKRLAGIVIDPDRRLAIFAVTGGKPLTLTEGETVSGWRIERISAAGVALSGPAGARTLQPKADTALARQPVFPATPAPQAAVQQPVPVPAAPPRFPPTPAGAVPRAGAGATGPAAVLPRGPLGRQR